MVYLKVYLHCKCSAITVATYGKLSQTHGLLDHYKKKASPYIQVTPYERWIIVDYL